MTAFIALAVVWMTASAVFASPIADNDMDTQRIHGQ